MCNARWVEMCQVFLLLVVRALWRGSYKKKAAYGRARASSYCIYSFFNVGRYAIPVARDAIPVARDAIPAARYAIRVSREGGNLHLGGIVGRLVDLYS